MNVHLLFKRELPSNTAVQKTGLINQFLVFFNSICSGVLMMINAKLGNIRTPYCKMTSGSFKLAYGFERMLKLFYGHCFKTFSLKTLEKHMKNYRIVILPFKFQLIIDLYVSLVRVCRWKLRKAVCICSCVQCYLARSMTM